MRIGLKEGRGTRKTYKTDVDVIIGLKEYLQGQMDAAITWKSQLYYCL